MPRATTAKARAATKPPFESTVTSRFALAAIMLAMASVVFFLPDAFSRCFLLKELLALLAGLLASRIVPAGRIPRGLWIIPAMTGDLRSARNELERAAELRPGDPTIESLLKQLP